jgi:hypothetical protein
MIPRLDRHESGANEEAQEATPLSLNLSLEFCRGNGYKRRQAIASGIYEELLFLCFDAFML